MLNIVGGFAYACGIDKVEIHTVNTDGVFYNIAGSSVNIAYNGAIITEETVKKSRFSYVCFAYNGYRNTVSEGLSGLEWACESIYFIVELLI